VLVLVLVLVVVLVLVSGSEVLVVGVPVDVGVPVVVVVDTGAPLSDSRWHASTVTGSATQPSLLASHRLQYGRFGSRSAQVASPF